MKLATILETSPEKVVTRRLSLGVNVPINERPERNPDAHRDNAAYKSQLKPSRRNSSAFLDPKYSLSINHVVSHAISRAFSKEGSNPKRNRRLSLDVYPEKLAAKLIKEPERKKVKVAGKLTTSTTLPNRRQSISNSRRRQSFSRVPASKAADRRQSYAYGPEETALPSYARPTMSSRKQRVKTQQHVD